MKKILLNSSVLIYLLSLTSNSFGSQIETQESSQNQYVCYQQSGKVITCSEANLLEAFHGIKAAEKATNLKDARKSLSPGKVLVTMGGVTFIVSVLGVRGSVSLSPSVIEKAAATLCRSIFGYGEGVTGLVFAGLTTVAGVVMLWLEPSSLGDGTVTGKVLGQDDVKKILSLSDEDLLSYSKMDARVSLRVMQVYTALGLLNKG